MKKIFISLLFVFLICLNVIAVSAKVSDITSNYSYEISSVIPSDVCEYAKSRFRPLLETVSYNSNYFGKLVDSEDNVVLGKPYIIFDVENDGFQDKLYYFPIIEKSKIRCILSISDVDGVYNASVSQGISDKLNDIDYFHQNYIIYSINYSLFAENEKKVNVILENSKYKNTEKASCFKNLDYNKKVAYIKKKFEQNSINESNTNISYLDKTKGFSEKSSSRVQLNTSGCLVSQRSDGNCWAASVATTLRYLNYNKYKTLTARKVCDKIKVGYNAGGNLVTRQKALLAYGVSYYNHFISYPMEFGLIQKNILKQRPILVSCVGTRSGGGHAVTVIGYTTYGGINQVVFHNSGDNKCVTSEYKKAGLTFSYNNEIFKWRSSLSCY